jgi:5-methylcytosine-specific restriction enzyme A
MPVAPPRACRAGCPYLRPCPLHSKQRWASRRGSRQARGYDAKHEAIRRELLRARPICEVCRIHPSSVADHRIPLARGGQTVRSNYQALCTSCSKTKTAREGAQMRATSTSRLQARAKGEAQASPVGRRLRDFPPYTPRGRR